MGDASECRVHARGEHQRLRFATRDSSPGEEHIAAAQQIGFGRGPCIARHRTRLTGDRGIADPHGECLDEQAISGHIVSATDEDDVARHDVLGRNHRRHTVALHSDLVRQQTLQRGHRFLSAVLLPEREAAVDHDHRHDGDRERCHALTRHPAIGAEREECRHPEQDGEEVRELAGKADEQRPRRKAGDAVGAELEPSRRSLDAREALR